MRTALLPELRRTQTFILAGGQGQRLHPLTASKPKPIVSFGGSFRILDFTLSNCLHSGLGRVSILTQYRYEELHRYVRNDWQELWTKGRERPPLVCLAAIGGKRYRGTADAVFRNAEHLNTDPSEFVLVLAGDHVYQMDYIDLLRQHVRTDADVTIATIEHSLHHASQFGVVDTNEQFRIVGFEEKPSRPRPMLSNPSMALVSMGVYVFKRRVLLESLHHFCERGLGYDFGHDIIPALIRTGRAFAFDFRQDGTGKPRYWRDIGTIDAYHQANMDLLHPGAVFDPYAHGCSGAQPTRHPHSENERTASERFALIDTSAHVNHSVLSPGVELESDAVVEDSVLMPGVHVGQGAYLLRTIVQEGVRIPPGFRAGVDLDQDRDVHTVTANGVVVVSETPAAFKRDIVHFAARRESTIVAGTPEVRPSLLAGDLPREDEVGHAIPPILFVDDDEEIRCLMRTYLEAQNISVITAENGLDALRIFQKNASIGLVVTDRNMPLMRGEVLVRELLKMNQKIKVIVASADISLEESDGLHEAHCLFKPYTPQQLVDAVREALAISGA